MALTASQVGQFHRDGFLVLRGLAPPTALDPARERLERLFARFGELPSDHAHDLAAKAGDAPAAEPINPEIIRCRELDADLGRSPLIDSLQGVARQLLDPHAVLTFDHAIRKPASLGAPTHWHQDAAYDPLYPRWHRLSCWIPFQRADATSGAIEYVPGTHRCRELMPHHKASEHAWTTQPPPGVEPIVCEVEPGDVVIHDHRTLHRASANQAARPRLVWVLIFGHVALSPWQRLRRNLSVRRLIGFDRAQAA